MGIVVLILLYMAMTLVAVVLGPLLYYWVTKRIIVFSDVTVKRHFLFWLIWVPIMTVSELLLRWVFGTPSPEDSPLNHIQTYGHYVWFTALVTHVAVSMKVFGENLRHAVKATITYSILFSILFAVIAILVLLFGIEPLFK